MNLVPAFIDNGGCEYFVVNSEGYFMINGEKLSYENAPRQIKALFYAEYVRDLQEVPERGAILKSIASGEEYETWMLCNFGGFNNTPDLDLLTGKISREFWDCGMKNTCIGYGIICRNQFNLTRTEYSIMKHYTDGLPDKLVSSELKISTNTLRNHNYSIFRKFGVSSKLEVIKKAENEGVIL